MPYAQNIVLNLAHLPEYFNATLTLLLTQHWDYRNQHLNFIEVKVQFFGAFVFECLQVTSVIKILNIFKSISITDMNINKSGSQLVIITKKYCLMWPVLR